MLEYIRAKEELFNRIETVESPPKPMSLSEKLMHLKNGLPESMKNNVTRTMMGLPATIENLKTVMLNEETLQPKLETKKDVNVVLPKNQSRNDRRDGNGNENLIDLLEMDIEIMATTTAMTIIEMILEEMIVTAMIEMILEEMIVTAMIEMILEEMKITVEMDLMNVVITFEMMIEIIELIERMFRRKLIIIPLRILL
jgi:hypothetical protein